MEFEGAEIMINKTRKAKGDLVFRLPRRKFLSIILLGACFCLNFDCGWRLL